MVTWLENVRTNTSPIFDGNGNDVLRRMQQLAGDLPERDQHRQTRSST
jgi:hypothetical protein